MATGGHEVDEALDALLVAPPGDGDGVLPAEVESVLTAGYARALELEAERLRLVAERRPVAQVEDVSERLASLRDRLDEAKRRYDGSGKHDLDGGTGAGR